MLGRLWITLRMQPLLAAIAGSAVLGVGVSVYLTIEHYAAAEPFCPVGGLVNCARVLASRYSFVPATQLPVTLPGLLWFLVSGGLATAALLLAARGRSEPAWLRPALCAWSGAGLLFVLYLVYAEIVLIRFICLWCTVVHLLTLLTFLAALAAWQKGPPAPRPVHPTRPRPPVHRRAPPSHAATTTRSQPAQPARHTPPRPPRSRRR
jgi:uncharacterized membrane protein